MSQQDVEVVRIEAGFFGGRVQQELGMLHNVAVHRAAAGDEHGHAGSMPAPCPTHLLPRSGNRARVTRQDRHVELAHVDAEFQGVRAHDSEQGSVAKAAFHCSTLRWQIPASIAANQGARAASEPQRFTQVGEHQLHGYTRSPKDQGLAAGSEERKGPPRCECLGGTTRTGGRIEERRLDHQDVPLSGGRSAAVHNKVRATRQE